MQPSRDANLQQTIDNIIRNRKRRLECIAIPAGCVKFTFN